jgi:membrane protein
MSFGVRERVSSATGAVREIGTVFREREVPFMAGSLAYSAFVSLLPLLLLAVLVASFLGGEALARPVLAVTGQYLTPAGQGLLRDALIEATGRFGLSVLSLAALVWGVTTLFRRLDTAFSMLYEVEERGSAREQFRDAVIVLAGMAVALVAMVTAGALYVAFSGIPYIRVVLVLGLVVALTIAFLPMYYVFPDADVTLREALPGVIVAVVGWSALQLLFQVYVTISAAGELYGVLGGVIILITWLYFAALVLLLGGVTNVVLGSRLTESADDAARTDRSYTELG